ncbi:PepSY domain-containing protein [Staphylococcus americanisciuri]|uniref:PepSY domain-containing protein n=1 Tax=Staphylococcus americanisciuri TaxID=2973940 RepID=A0ABT2F2Q8_9STAP|nr:PepSY domain-containing protein [Staphylococcus americanisciuri]MCS4486674.1 PepSY domain-containing protein [Staphylococcus americanisciuri]
MKFKILTLLLSAGIVLAACGNDDDNQSDNQQANNQSSSQTTTKSDNNTNQDDTNTSDNQSSTQQSTKTTVDLNEIKTQPEEAIKTAQQSFDGQVKKIEYKQDNGQWIYKIDLVNGNNEAEVKVSDQDNKVLASEEEVESDNQTQKVIDLDNVVSYKEAVETAQKEMNGDLKQWKLNHDNGKLVYEVELMDQNKDTEIIVDAKTGKVMGTDQ